MSFHRNWQAGLALTVLSLVIGAQAEGAVELERAMPSTFTTAPIAFVATVPPDAFTVATIYFLATAPPDTLTVAAISFIASVPPDSFTTPPLTFAPTLKR